MYHELPRGASFWRFLFSTDEDLANTTHKQPCPCGGRLHRANYPRNPRGGPDDLPESEFFVPHVPGGAVAGEGDPPDTCRTIRFAVDTDNEYLTDLFEDDLDLAAEYVAIGTISIKISWKLLRLST